MKCFKTGFMKHISSFSVALVFAICLVGCSTNPAEEPSKNIYAYFMYALGQDSGNKVQCVAEFKTGSEDGDYIGLEKGTRLFIDTSELEYSILSRYSSYSTEQEPAAFIGKHKWAVQLPGGNRITYDFEVVPFIITSVMPETVGQSDIEIKCDNLTSADEVFMFLSGNLSGESENYLEIKPSNGSFIIPKTFF